MVVVRSGFKEQGNNCTSVINNKSLMYALLYLLEILLLLIVLRDSESQKETAMCLRNTVRQM